MTESRRAIPEELKRAIRQRCGFGCVICGIPLVHIDHIEDYSVVLTHEESNLTLLCPSHHQEKTNGLLSREAVRAANDDPWNLRTGVTTPYLLHYGEESPTFVISGQEFRAPAGAEYFVPFMIDGAALILVEREAGQALISLRMNDVFDFPQLIIARNEILMSAAAYDVQLKGNTLTIREAPGKILVELVFDVSANKVRLERGTFRLNGVQWVIAKDQPIVLPTQTIGSISIGAASVTFGTQIGLGLGICPPDASIGARIPQIDRYTRGPAKLPKQK
ncbi:HNH endonuclease [uncultured Jatrophihabitans sp.]|uniref:HNH endonuclease n=1 Tax=uncultured Jatrophihabitans sp. TaxID=1610747 RepID=UPI0035CA1F51